ncbi:MAG: 30S ribosomal protein S2 [Rhodospirillales bacterium]|nr:30S ribosomal protein S2 [Rhodospirillales bacterium]
MALPTFTMRQLVEAGVHFGHNTRRWNPKMGPYLFGVRSKIHIIDLQQTVPMLYQAMKAVEEVVSAGGRVLFVGTKRQASGKVAEAAKKCGQYYVNHRWLGGMMTNWRTISNSIKQLRTLEEQLEGETQGLTKKELLRITRLRDKLDRALGGIKDMGGLPDIMFVIDTNKEAIAIAEANKLGIPVVAVLDSNSNPDGIQFPIPGNDDAIRAISMYCDLIAGTVLSGIREEMTATGGDVGESEEVPVEVLPEEVPAKETPAEEAKAEEAKAEEAPAEEPKAEEAKAEEPKAEEAKAEEPKAEEPKAEEPKAEEAAAEEPKAEA